MNIRFIVSGAALAGAATGAVVAWAITADRAERKAESMSADFFRMDKTLREKMGYASHLELEVERLNTYVDELEQKLFAQDENSPGGTLEEIVSVGTEVDFPEGESPEETKEKLRAQISQYTSDPDVAEFIGESARIVVESTRNEPPYVIPHTIFAIDGDDEGREYAKVTYTYYEKHRVLLDEDDDVVPQKDIEQIVGWRNLNRFGDESDNPDVVYIRNRASDTDFEVVRELDEDPPLYVKLGMDKETYDARKSSGLLKFREGDV